MNWSFASREAVLKPSPIRTAFDTTHDKQVISLAGGNPDVSLLPHNAIATITQRLLNDRGAEILQYGSGAGIPQLREVLADLMSQVGATGLCEHDLLITSGSQMGIDLVTKLLCNPGDTVLAEGPTYIGALNVFASYEVAVEQLPIDTQGLDPEGVALAL
ncbi:MAG: aminotransferase class I/II-fold pyridoxal phosphate-dependent enzyme, partial [Propionibacteriaceae bacterium]|nr:aminotransferase class I/II-fold pyridoxal phosphate-dependent enzyme [Propionibacteriaceae bacterium]